MATIFGKEPPPLKHGHVWVGSGVRGRRPDTLVQAAQAGAVAGSQAPPAGSSDRGARSPGAGVRCPLGHAVLEGLTVPAAGVRSPGPLRGQQSASCRCDVQRPPAAPRALTRGSARSV